MSALIFASLLLATVAAANVIPGREFENRIVGGSPATVGQFPFVASIQSQRGHMCGGAIISTRYIVTAAHCVDNQPLNTTVLRLGKSTQNQTGTEYRIAVIKKHPGFNFNTRANDIALIQTVQTIAFTAAIQPIAVSVINQTIVNATIAGWGSSVPSQNASTYLQYLNTQTILNADCQARHASSGYASLVLPSNICTFTRQGQGVCDGDNGGPLFVGNQLIGILSFGNGCGAGYPDVYTRISYYRDWLMQNTSV